MFAYSLKFNMICSDVVVSQLKYISQSISIFLTERGSMKGFSISSRKHSKEIPDTVAKGF